MRKLIAFGLLSLSATSYAQVCVVDMVNIYNNSVVRTFSAYDCIEAKKQCSKSVRLDYGRDPHASSLSCIIRNSNPYPNPNPNPNPYPNPNPNPYPNPYPPTYGVTISGIIEDQPFTFMARDASELYINCLSDIRRVVYGSADELFFSANNARFVSASTAGWYNDTQICSILEQEARRSYNMEYTSPMRVVGSLERAPFQIEAMDRAELLRNCISAFTATRQGSTDELTFSLNGAPFQRITTSGWWGTPARACKAMIIHLDNQIR